MRTAILVVGIVVVIGALALVLFVLLAPRVADARADGFRARFERDRDAMLARPARPDTPVTEAELAPLPELMRTYLRRSGAVGRPHVRNMRVVFDARMRSSATAAWMASTAEQYESFDPPARLFRMKASRAGVPFDVLHRYVDGAATFQVRIAGMLPMVDKHGPDITHDETVTLMNDILVMAPAAVLTLPFTWEVTDRSTLRATFTNAGYAVRADLRFDDAGDLIGFVSDDRAHDRDGGPARWSTPIGEYRVVDGIRVGTRGDANWIEPRGEWTYGRFTIRSIAYNVAP